MTEYPCLCGKTHRSKKTKDKHEAILSAGGKIEDRRQYNRPPQYQRTEEKELEREAPFLSGIQTITVKPKPKIEGPPKPIEIPKPPEPEPTCYYCGKEIVSEKCPYGCGGIFDGYFVDGKLACEACAGQTRNKYSCPSCGKEVQLQ